MHSVAARVRARAEPIASWLRRSDGEDGEGDAADKPAENADEEEDDGSSSEEEDEDSDSVDDI